MTLSNFLKLSWHGGQVAKEAAAVGDRREIDAAHAKASEEITKLHRKQVRPSAHALVCLTKPCMASSLLSCLACAFKCIVMLKSPYIQPQGDDVANGEALWAKQRDRMLNDGSAWLLTRHLVRRAAQDMARGSLDTVSEGVRRARAQLTGDKEFHNVDERFHKQNALVLTTRMAASDLEKYHRARSAPIKPLSHGLQPLCARMAGAEALHACALRAVRVAEKSSGMYHPC